MTITLQKQTHTTSSKQTIVDVLWGLRPHLIPGVLDHRISGKKCVIHLDVKIHHPMHGKITKVYCADGGSIPSHRKVLFEIADNASKIEVTEHSKIVYYVEVETLHEVTSSNEAAYEQAKEQLSASSLVTGL